MRVTFLSSDVCAVLNHHRNRFQSPRGYTKFPSRGILKGIAELCILGVRAILETLENQAGNAIRSLGVEKANDAYPADLLFDLIAI